ncbi:hypothetical protein CRX67_16915 [Enterobacteriaceae bacterium A-F18]|nr:hypothetical protein C9415_13485 [Kluyvera sp. Nf5]QIH64623.1 hypothetical protein CRX67_16915 [Enterobacteriaceae bacterium A-F18]BBE79058.1 hypothetical protein MRY16398_41140 [Phytobacter sp. MRY16-398]
MNVHKVDGDPIGKNKKATSRVALDLKYPWVLQRQSYWHRVARQDKSYRTDSGDYNTLAVT